MTRRIGAISDIHADAAALATVLEWLGHHGVSEVVCAGDIAGFGPYPNQCVSMLAGQGVRAVMGNSDFNLLHPRVRHEPVSRRSREIDAIEDWVRRQLSEQSRSFLRALPDSLSLEGGVLVVHGSPGDLSGVVSQTDAPPPIAEGIKVVVAGHLHVPFISRYRSGIWVNVGSAGRPCDGDPRPAVCVLTESGGAWMALQHRIPYNPQESVRDVRLSGMPFAENLASAILEARWYR